MAGFMSGFGTTLAQLIEEDRKYYRDAAAKRRDYIQTYGTRAVTDRENKANAAKGVFNYLISNDISEEDARYVLNTSGVQGLAQLKATIDSRTDLTADERSKLVKKAKDYVDENPDEDINSVLKRAYGLYKSTDNPVKRERSMFASMLGLDSRMMEDEVLDDLYINGYTGRDIYRIMGSAEAQTGTALDLDLPSKPPSPTVLNNTAKFLESQFDTSIDSRISSIEQQMLKADPDSTDYKDLNDERTKLENLKAKGLLALGQYAAAYDPALFDFARAQEEALPGSITRNSYLFEFLPAYQTHFEEGKDEAKVAAAGDRKTVAGEPKGDAITSTDIKTDIFTYETDEELNAAVESGKVVRGVTPVRKGEDGELMVVPAAAEPKTVDLGDMTGAPGFRERDDIPEAVTEINIPKRSSWSPTSQPAGEDGRLLRTDDILFDTLVYDRQNESFPDSFYIDEGYSQEQLDRVKKEVDAAFKSTQATPEAAPDIDAALDRLPDHLEKLGSQGMDAWRKFTKAVNEYSYTMPSRPLSQRQLTDTPSNTLGFMIVGAMVDTLGEAAETTEDLETFTNVFTRASDTPAYKQLEELIQERKNIPAKKAKKVVEKVQELEVDQAMLGYVQKMDEMGRTPSREEAEKLKTILEQKQLIDTSTDELYRGPISGKTLVEKLDDIYNFYTQEDTEYNPRTVGTVGFQDLGLRSTADDVRYPRSESPDAQTRTRAPLGDTRTDPDATLPTSMVAEQMTTRGKKARPSGLMSPPSSGTAPKLGQAEFGDLIDRVHGSSKAAEAFNNKVSSGKVTAADVTRLIKATRKLPKTTSKDKLLNSLFDLRDALNNR